MSCSLVYRIEEYKDEITDDLVVNILKDTTDIELSEKGIDRSHRIGKPSLQKKPITVQFVQ